MSPRTKAQFEEIRETTSQKIMQSALELFATHGFDATSISQIADHAGISKGLIYNYFDSKEQLLKALVQSIDREEEKIIVEVVDPDPSRMLEKIFVYFFREMRENEEQWKLIAALTLQAGKFEFIQQKASEKIEKFCEILEGLLRSIGIDRPRREAKLIAAIFDGVGFQAMVIGKKYPLDEMEKFLIDKYCKHEK